MEENQARQSPLHPLEGFLVLSVAPVLDFKSIQALRLTSRTIKETLDLYERSAVAENLARKSFPIKPQGTLLCSSFPDRPRIGIETFAAIKELEDRQRKIDWLVQCSKYLRRGHLRCGIERNVTSAQRKNITTALKRGLWICTDIADLEARERVRRENEMKERTWDQRLDCQHEPSRPRSGSLEDYRTDHGHDTESSMLATVITHGHRTPHVHHDGTSHGHASSATQHDSTPETASAAARAVRQAQLDYINNLSTKDLAAVLVIMNLSTRGFEDYLGPNRLTTYPRDIITEWTVAVSENAVRHGVFFLYPQALRGSPSMEGDHCSGSSSRGVCVGSPRRQTLPSSTPRGPRNISKKGASANGYLLEGKDRQSIVGACPAAAAAPTASDSVPCCKSCSRRMAATAAAMVCNVVEEMQLWESGEHDDMLPGLGMTIRGLLRDRLGCDTDDLTHNCAMIVRGKMPVYGNPNQTMG